MRLPLERDRLLAVGLLGLVLALVYLVGVHWWWTLPQLQMQQEMTELREQELRLRMHASQTEAVQQRLLELREQQAGNEGFLAEPSEQLATAALVQQLEAVVRSAAARDRCQLAGTTPQASRVQERYPRVVVQVRLRCGMEELATILGQLEGGSPELFIDNLVIRSLRTAPGRRIDVQGDGSLDVAFELYGYLNVREDGA